MTVVSAVSLFAATLSMVSYVPQAWSIIRTRSTENVSLPMYIVTVVGFIAWLGYGILVGQWPIIVQNIICLGLSTFILTMKLLPQRKMEAVADTLAPDIPENPGP